MEKSSKLLKIASILMIIGAILTVIVAVVLAVIGGILAGAGGTATIVVLVVIGLIIGIIGSIIQLIAGITGVKNFNKPEKAKTCIIFGVIVLVLSLADVIFSAAGSGEFGVNQVTSIISGLLIPVLYLVGALQLKKAAAEPAAPPPAAE